MLRTISPNISIITNWGCPSKCWYCIWKGHPLENVNLETDWTKLREFLWKNRHKHKVSVSGGGDCLYKYEEHSKWWRMLLKTCDDYGLKVDVHSRNIIKKDDFWKQINRVVMSSDITDDVIDNLLYLYPLVKIRVVHLVTDKSSPELIKKYIDMCGEFDCQFTLKELVNFNDKGNYNKFKRMFPEQYFLDTGDYNIYYFPNNEIGTNFMNPKEFKLPNYIHE